VTDKSRDGGVTKIRGKQSRIYAAMEERPDEAAIDKPKGLMIRIAF
jgi:hypothetical protein